MTVQTNTNVANFLGNGAATYPIGFKFNSAADLVVQKTVIATGVTTTLTLNSDYSVAGAGVEEGGSITFSQAPTSAESIKVTRVVDLLQLTDLRNQGKFYAEVHEEVFDKLVMIDQQQQTELDDANARSDEAVATANAANAKSDQAVAKAAQNLVDMQAQYDAFEQGASFVVIGDYATGQVVDGYNKIFRKDGEFYRAAASLDLPYTLTGNWATESVNFVSVGDDVLRQELANSTDPAKGAGMVGHKGGSVAGVLDTLAARADEAGRFRFSEIILNKVNENRDWIYPWGGRGVTVLGDSISHMAFSRDAFKNNWTNILKRCINAEFDKGSYGFVSLLPTLGSGAKLSREVHAVTRTGTWTELTKNACEWSVSGFALQSSTAGDSLDVVVPTFQRHFGVWYHSFAGGGSFEIYVNDVLKATVSTDGAAGSTRTSGMNIGRLDMIDNGKGACKITLKVASGTVRLIGISYENAEYDFQLSNFAQSGRKLRWVSQEVIQKCVRGSATFILALGYNDNAEAEADPVYLAAVQQRIDWIIAEANTYGVKLLVLDFIWTRAQTRALPTELKRCADAVPGSTYLRFGEFLKMDGSLADGTWLTDNIRLYDDAAHPNILGHKLIGETVAKVLGLSVSSKRAALDLHDFWMPVQLTGNMRNTFTDPLLITAFKRQGSVLLFRVYLYNETVNNSTTAVPAGTYDFITSESMPSDVYVPTTTFYPLAWSTAEGESVTPYISAFLEARLGYNGFRLLVKTTTKRNIDGVVVVPVFRSQYLM